MELRRDGHSLIVIEPIMLPWGLYSQIGSDRGFKCVCCGTYRINPFQLIFLFLCLIQFARIEFEQSSNPNKIAKI